MHERQSMEAAHIPCTTKSVARGFGVEAGQK